MNSFVIPLFACLSISIIAPSAMAATFDVEVIDLRPIQAPTIHVTMTGTIVAGDAARLSTLLAEHRQPQMRDILFIMDSPGGSLPEGLAIGQVIAALPEITTAQVGTTDAPDAICASACVLSYLGADYRYLGERSRIGVHRFAAPDAEMDGAEALSLAQELSGVLTEYIRAQRADPAFYERMVRTPFEGISWVERDQLEEWRVITGPVYDEWTEYRNVNGSVALELSQVSLYGDSSLTLLCGDQGLVGIASLNKPELVAYGQMELAVDGGALEIESYDIVDETGMFVRVAFAIPVAYAPRLSVARSFGVRIFLPSGYGFFGFEMRLRDGRLGEMVETCQPTRASGPSTLAMRPIQGIDLPGGDMTSSGLRGISLEECLRTCEADAACQAVSYVTDLRWCWPKTDAGVPIAAAGVVSAVK